MPNDALAIRGPASEWPVELAEVFELAVICEYVSLTRAEAPITVSMTPYGWKRNDRRLQESKTRT